MQEIQYIIVAALLLMACYSIYRMLRKNFSPKKFDSKRKNCGSDCGCNG